MNKEDVDEGNIKGFMINFQIIMNISAQTI